jgi:putative membrane protein
LLKVIIRGNGKILNGGIIMRWLCGSGGFGMSGPFMLFFWVVVIVGLVYLFKTRAKNRNRFREKTPLDILNERYAKGEISEDDYQRIKEKL